MDKSFYRLSDKESVDIDGNYFSSKINKQLLKAIKKNECLVAGGSLLSHLNNQPINDFDIYVGSSKFESFMVDIPQFHVYNANLQTIYSKSFFIKNKILFRFGGNLGLNDLDNNNSVYRIKYDIIVFNDSKTDKYSVVNNFDLTFCEIWFDGNHIYTSSKKNYDNIKGFKGELKQDYFKLFFEKNKFTLSRLDKYSKKGYKIHVPCNNIWEVRNDVKPTVNENIYDTLILRLFIKTLFKPYYTHRHGRPFRTREGYRVRNQISLFFDTFFKKKIVDKEHMFTYNTSIYELIFISKLRSQRFDELKVLLKNIFNKYSHIIYFDIMDKLTNPPIKESPLLYLPYTKKEVELGENKNLPFVDKYRIKFTDMIDVHYFVKDYYHPNNDGSIYVINHSLKRPSDFYFKIGKGDDKYENINKKEAFNIISGENKIVAECLAEKDTFVFYINKSYMYFLRDELENMFTNKNDNWVYKCPKINRKTDLSEVYINCSFNINIYVFYQYVYHMLKSDSSNLFYVQNSGETLEELQSYKNSPPGYAINMPNFGNNRAVSALHCQPDVKYPLYKIRECILKFNNNENTNVKPLFNNTNESVENIEPIFNNIYNDNNPEIKNFNKEYKKYEQNNSDNNGQNNNGQNNNDNNRQNNNGQNNNEQNNNEQNNSDNNGQNNNELNNEQNNSNNNRQYNSNNNNNRQYNSNNNNINNTGSMNSVYY